MPTSGTVVVPRMKGFVSLAAHPSGCAANVAAAIEAVKRPRRPEANTAPPVVVIGCSTGYGLASAIVAAFRHHAPVIGVCLERAAKGTRTGSAGWYNLAALRQHADAEGLSLDIVNGDCFDSATKQRVINCLARHSVGPSTLIYSVAAPARTMPDTGETARSALRALGRPFTTKTLHLDTGRVTDVEVPPATDAEIEGTRRVMGGEDWQLWVDALRDADVLAEGFRTIAYTYVGPRLTHPIYRSGTIGVAKDHLETTAATLDATLHKVGGHAYTSVNSAAVTQASAAIPVVPLYLSILLAVTRDLGVTFESPVEQARRLFDDLADGTSTLDDQGRIRLDQWELRPDVQEEVTRRWALLNDDNLDELADVAGYARRFRQLFGFDVTGVDYQAPVDLDIPVTEASPST